MNSSIGKWRYLKESRGHVVPFNNIGFDLQGSGINCTTTRLGLLHIGNGRRHGRVQVDVQCWCLLWLLVDADKRLWGTHLHPWHHGAGRGQTPAEDIFSTSCVSSDKVS